MPQTILIVDDLIPMHELIKLHLRAEPWTIQSAYDGVSALAQAASMLPDLILLDLDLPDMNGFDVCRHLKIEEATSHIPVIFLTASASVDEKVCGLNLQAVDYITKPFEPAELCLRIRTALRTKLLLDTISKSSAEFQSDKSGGSGSKQVNARLSMSQMIRARRYNPWNRAAPQEPHSATSSAEGGGRHN